MPTYNSQPSVMCEYYYLTLRCPPRPYGKLPPLDYINDGVYGSFNCIMFDHQQVEPYVLTIERSFHLDQFAGTPVVPSSVWGPTCDSIDCVCPLTNLPPSLEVGDWVGFRNMGAYTTCAASQFNGFQRSLIRYTLGVGPDSQAVLRALKQYSAKN